MRFSILFTAGLASCAVLAASAHAQAARHYDCSKPGNATKSACKAAAAPPSATTALATAPAPLTKTTRHYDCSKAGNADKAACKGVTPTPAAASTVAPAAAAPAAPAKKPSLLDRLRSRKPATTPAETLPAQGAPSASAASAPASGSYRGKSITTDPTGATGQCKDGTYTHATHHSGACSRHGGVAKWL